MKEQEKRDTNQGLKKHDDVDVDTVDTRQTDVRRDMCGDRIPGGLKSRSGNPGRRRDCRD